MPSINSCEGRERNDSRRRAFTSGDKSRVKSPQGKPHTHIHIAFTAYSITSAQVCVHMLKHNRKFHTSHTARYEEIIKN